MMGRDALVALLLAILLVPLVGMITLRLTVARAHRKRRFVSTQARRGRVPAAIRVDDWIRSAFRKVDGMVSLSERARRRQRRARRARRRADKHADGLRQTKCTSW
jgi:hypothetical protein